MYIVWRRRTAPAAVLGSHFPAPAAARGPRPRRTAPAGKLLGAARGARLRQLLRAARGRGRAALHGPAAARDSAVDAAAGAARRGAPPRAALVAATTAAGTSQRLQRHAGEAAAAPRRARRPLNIKQCALMFSSNTIMYILIIINIYIIDIQMYNLHYFCTLLFINVNINKQNNVHYCNQ